MDLMRQGDEEIADQRGVSTTRGLNAVKIEFRFCAMKLGSSVKDCASMEGWKRSGVISAQWLPNEAPGDSRWLGGHF